MKKKKNKMENKIDKTKKLDCHTCHNEIPKSAGMHAEGEDYVLHFCGKTCYDSWKVKQKK